jgi:hypothetical protein
MDLSKLSDSDLQALASQDLSKVSDEGLAFLGSSSQPVQPQPQEEGGLGKVAGLGVRAAIEGVASLPAGAYNTASLLSNALRGRLPKAGEKNEWGVPDQIDTQQYGTALADKIGLPQAEKDSIPMDIARTVLSGGIGGAALKATGYLPKVASIMGANNPIRTAMGTAAGIGASDVTQEMTKDSDNQAVKIGAPLAAGILGNMAGSGLGKVGSYITNPNERGADALLRQSAKTQNELPDDLAIALEPHGANLYDGVQPTAAMTYKNPAIGDAETMARLRNKGAFFDRDTQNTRLIAEALRGKSIGDSKSMMNALNAQTTPLRENALNQARASGGFEIPVKDRIDELLSSPGTRYEPQVKTLTNPISSVLESADIDPLDLYSRRKALADALNNKSPMTMDELTNAAKNQRREATILKNSIDEGLDTSSTGAWSDYLTQHREGMKPINELEAWQQVNKRFENKPEIEAGIPQITPHALRNAVSKETYSKSGRDLLSASARQDAEKMVQTMNAMERARSPRAAISGSQTTPLAMEVTKQLIPDKAKPIVSLMGGMKDFLTGNTALDDALLNPEKLPSLIEMAIKNKDQSVLNALRKSVIKQSILQNSGAQ